MNRRDKSDVLFRGFILLLITILAWPAFVAMATLVGQFTGEAWQFDAWNKTPKRLVIATFLDGYRSSAPIALAIGLIAVIDHWLLSRASLTWLFGGILLPLAGLGLYLWKLTPVSTALPVLVGTGLLLAILYRLVDAVWYRFT